jgi:hypothetical protein
LRAQCKLLLASTPAWIENTLDLWIADAIRAYSSELPRTLRHTQALTTGTQAYDLPGGHGFIALAAVEYPTGESPPLYLNLAEEWADEFQNGDYVYAMRGIADDVLIAADNVAGKIVFAQTVATGESALLTYRGLHTIPDIGDDDGQITVPRAHWEALIAFVEFRAAAGVESDATLAEAVIEGRIGDISLVAERKWKRFRSVMDRLVGASAGVGAGGSPATGVGGETSAAVRWGDYGL